MQAGIGIQQVNTFEDCRPSRKTKEFIIKPIPLEVVEKTWKKISKMPLGESPKLINLMRKQQSVVLAYLLAAGHKTLNQDEQELLLYMGIVVWQIMLQGSNPLIKATKSALDEAEKANIKMLEYLEPPKKIKDANAIYYLNQAIEQLGVEKCHDIINEYKTVTH